MTNEIATLQQLYSVQERLNQVMKELCPDNYSYIDVAEQMIVMIPLSVVILEKQATNSQIQEFISLEL